MGRIMGMEHLLMDQLRILLLGIQFYNKEFFDETVVYI
jgi:hypothetical protein